MIHKIALYIAVSVLVSVTGEMRLQAQTYKNEHPNAIVLAGNGSDITHTLTITAPVLSGNSTLTLPGSNAAGILTNNGSGVLSWLSLGSLFTNPMIAPGDMIYGGLLGAPSRLAATSTANQILLSGANAAPSWSTATYPATSGIAGNYLRSDGTNFVSSGIQAGDVPTLNQNTTGSAAKLTTARTIAGNSFDGSANTTFANKFIVQGTSDAGLTGAQFLGSLATGLVKNTTTTGVLSTATAGTDYSAGTSALATGILKSTTATGALSIAVAADFPTLNQNTTGTAATATNATNVATTLQTVSASTFYPTFVPSNTTSTGQAANVATGLSYVPSTGTLSATTFSGTFSGNATGFTGSLAGDVTGTQGATAINTTSAAGGHIISALTTNAGALTNNTTGSAAKLTTARTIAGTSFDGSANIALANKFIVQGTSDAGLTGAQYLGSLATGLVKNTTTTGVLSTATAGTDYSAGTSALATGILKSTTATGALSIAVAADFPTLNQNTTGTAATATNATNVATTLQTVSASTFYPTFVPSNSTSAGQAANVATGLSYVPSTGTLSATTFSGAFSGNATGFTGSLAGDVTGTQGATAINTSSAAGGHIISALTANASTLTNNTTGSAAKLTTARTIAGTSFDGSANIALANKFIVQGTSDAGLTGAQFLGSLATGLVKNTTTTGVLSTATAGTDYSAGTSALATGILKSTTATGALSIAVAADFPTLNQNTTGTASNVTGVVALANGGTGVTNASGVAQNAVFAGPSSGGAGAASWRALAASDLPSGSGHYIQDETAQQTGASFNVDGSGAVGTTFTAGVSVSSPILYGGSAAGSTLNLASTSSASPSGDYVTVTTGGAERARFNSAGQLGVATNAPNTALDVNGDFAMRVSGNSTATTTFDSLPTTGTSVIDITGATGNFTIASIGQGYNGKHLTIYNRTAHTMTIKNENATSTAANRIKTLSGADVSITSNSSDGAVAEFIYDTNTTRWIYESSAGNTISGLSAVGINYTVVAANEEFNSSGVSDPYITFYGLAGATYEVRGILIVKDSNNSNGDAINIGFATASSSSTMEVTVWGASGVPTGNTQFQGSSIIESDGTGGEVSVPAYKASNGAETFYNVTGVIKPAASGQVHLVWKTVGNGVGAGVLKANSYIAFTRVN